MTHKRLATLALYGIFIVLGICATLLGPTLIALTSRFGIELKDGGFFQTLQFAGALMAVLMGGWLMDRLNARYILAGGAFLLCVGLIGLSLAESRFVAFACTFAFGVGYGMLTVGPNLAIQALHPEKAGVALNWLNVYYGVGAIIGPIMVGAAINIRMEGSFRLAYLAAGLLGMASVLPLSFVRARIQKAGSAPGKRTPIPLLPLVPFALFFLFYVGAEIGFQNWLAPHMTKVALAAGTATLATSLFAAGLTAGRAVGGVILLRLKEDQVILLSLALMAVSAGVLLLFQTVELINLIAAFGFGFGCGPVYPTMLAFVGKRLLAAKGAASGLLMAAGNSGAALMPFLQGQIGAGVSGGMILPFLLSLALIGLALAVRRRPEVSVGG